MPAPVVYKPLEDTTITYYRFEEMMHLHLGLSAGEGTKRTLLQFRVATGGQGQGQGREGS